MLLYLTLYGYSKQYVLGLFLWLEFCHTKGQIERMSEQNHNFLYLVKKSDPYKMFSLFSCWDINQIKLSHP